MKTVRTFLFVAFAACLAIAGCEKNVSVQVDSVVVEPESLSLAIGEERVLSVSVLPENAEGTVVWSSSNPETADVTQDGTVTAKAVGETEITAAIGGKSAVCIITVSENGQGGDELDIALEVLGSGLYDVDYRITADPENATYLTGAVTKERFSAFASESEFVNDEIENIRSSAADMGVDASEYLSGMLKSGSSEYTLTGLSAGTGYVLYAVGMDADFTVTSGIVTEEFKTQEPQADALFLYEPEFTDSLGVNVTVTPGEDMGMYYFIILDESVVNWRYGGADEMVNGTLYEDFRATVNELVVYMEMSVAEALNTLCWKEKQIFPCTRMIPDSDYYMIGVGVDPDTGEFVTDVYYETVHSPESGDLSEFSVEFRLGGIVLNQIKVVTVPSDKMVRYYFSKTSADATEEEIIAGIEALIEGYISDGLIADANGFYSSWCSCGSDEFTFTNLAKGETFVIYAYGIDNEGGIGTELMFSEEFTNE